MKFPWVREKRAADYTDAAIESLVAHATGETVNKHIASVAVCLGMYSRAFMSAEVKPETDALTPEVLALIGRLLVFPGQSLFEIVVDGGITLRPVSQVSISGGPSPESWMYEVELAGPSVSETKTLPASAVVHIKPMVDPARPWQGVSPIADAGVTVDGAAALENSLKHESGTAVGQVIASPPGKKTTLQNDLRALRGRLSLVDSMASGWEQGSSQGVPSDYKAQRLGPVFSENEGAIRDSLSAGILAACGIPVSVLGRSDGTLARESFRQFIGSTIMPLSKLVTAELSDKLDLPGLRFDFSALRSSDVYREGASFFVVGFWRIHLGGSR